MDTQVFWDLPVMNIEITEVDNQPLFPPLTVDQFIEANPGFEILEDDTNVSVLTFSGTTSITLTYQSITTILNSTSVVADMFGGRPIRK